MNVSIIQALVLAIIQGLTEFIPVSSSGHLLLAQKAMGLPGSGFTFDVALHIGTLLALILFFREDIVRLVKALFAKTTETRLVWLLVCATIPAAIIGFLLESAAESRFRSATLVSINLALFGLVMLLAERYALAHKQRSDLDHLTTKQALAMGFAQAAAVVPGVSRSGSTITAGLFVGLDRVSATRFSFLLGIPITIGAVLRVLLKQSALSEISKQTPIFSVGVVVAFITGMFAIKFMLKYLSKHSLAAFAYYRLSLAAVVLMLMLVR